MHFVSPEFAYWFELALKMAVTALFVSVATVIAERLGPTVGALVATLPVSAGPVFLALDHDTAFISASAVASDIRAQDTAGLEAILFAGRTTHKVRSRPKPLKTAKTLGLTFPQTLLATADELIE